ncbi:MAG: hypothetical protein ACFE9I_03330 [Candidatus Hermodarchaeota archaeon]
MKAIYEEFYCPQCRTNRFIYVEGICSSCRTKNDLEQIIYERKNLLQTS